MSCSGPGVPGGESSWSLGRSVGGVGRRPVSRGGGGTVVSMWGVWGGWFLWEGGVWCGCLAGGGLRESTDVFVGGSGASWSGSCVSGSGISLTGASGTGPVVFWVTWFTVTCAGVRVGFTIQGTSGWRVAFSTEGSFQCCILVAKGKEFLVHGVEAPFHLIHSDGG